MSYNSSVSLDKYYSLDNQDSAAVSVTGAVRDPAIAINRRSARVSSAYVPQSRLSRYSASLKQFKPFRRNKDDSILSVEKAGLFSFITSSWVQPYLWRGFMGHLDEDNLPKCPQRDSCELNGQRLDGLWSSEVVRSGKSGASFGRVAWKFISTRAIIASIIYLSGINISMIISTYFLYNILDFLKVQRIIPALQASEINLTNEINGIELNMTRGIIDDVETMKMGQGLVLVFCLAISEFFSYLLITASISISLRTATRLRNACLGAAFKKVVNSSVINPVSAQQMIGFIDGDGQVIHNFVLGIPILSAAPKLFITFILFSYKLMGVRGLIAICVIVLYYPVLAILIKISKRYRKKYLKESEKRMGIMEEFLTNIVLIKMTQWNKLFTDQITESRKKELKNLNKSIFYDNCCFTFLFTQPLFTVAILFLTVWDANITANFEEDLEVSTLTFFIFLMVHMKISLDNFWIGLNAVSKASLSFQKLKQLLILNAAERPIDKPVNRDTAVSIINGGFTWNANYTEAIPSPAVQRKRSFRLFPSNDRESKDQNMSVLQHAAGPLLNNIDFNADKGKLIGICGFPGSGKSSLLLAILGHMKKTSGQIMRDGKLNYIGKQPWLFNGSIKDNILFEESFETQKYYRAVHSCHLTDDLNRLPALDETFAGEVPLSFAQKQKIALCRAVYSNSDIYLFDNPLSAIDLETSFQIFDKCILKTLHGKTIIMVTEKIKFLNRCDLIYVMKNGTIIEHGTHDDLLEQNQEYSKLVRLLMNENRKKYYGEDKDIFGSVSDGLHGLTKKNASNHSNDDLSVSNGNSRINSRDAIVTVPEDDDSETEDGLKDVMIIPEHNYYSFLSRAGGVIFTIFILFFILINSLMLAVVAVSFIEIFKANWYDAKLRKAETNIEIPIGAFSGVLSILFLTGMITTVFYSKAVYKSAKRFHNLWLNNVSAATVEYFQSSPISNLINRFSLDLYTIDVEIPDLLFLLLHGILTIMLTIGVLLYVSYWFLAPIVAYHLLYFIITRYIRLSQLKLYEIENSYHSPISSQIINAVSGRAVIQANKKNREFIKTFYSLCNDSASQLYIINAAKYHMQFLIQFLSVCLVLVIGIIVVNYPNVAPAYGCLILLSTLHLCATLQKAALIASDVKASFQSLARIHLQMKSIDSEYSVDHFHTAPEGWPSSGHCGITFHDVKLKLQSDMPLILKGMNFQISNGEKIGIVGPADSGKRGIVAALFRLAEPLEGYVKIGDDDIKQIPLDVLRSAITIIPQDPVLFNGSIKYNLDPLSQQPDLKLVEALQSVELWDVISKLPLSIDSPAALLKEPAHRQLLYLARAWLNKNKILVIEECLSDIENKVEKIVNGYLKNQFADATVILIVNQILAALHCDRVFVVSDGMVVEVGTPINLYRNKNSKFSAMVTNSRENLFETAF